MITCRILTPNGPYSTIETDSLLLNTVDGERGLLEHHMPITLLLDIGKMVTSEKGRKKVYAIAGGICYFEKGEARICVNSIESADEIDTERAKEAMKRADERLNSHDENWDLRRAELALKKALNRISIASYR